MTNWLERTSYMGFKEVIVVPRHAASIPRFSMLVCGMFCSIAIAAIYSYSLITDKMREDYKYTQNDITSISTVGIVIGYMTFPFGILYDYIGPKPIFAIGLILNALGALLFALTFNGTIHHSVTSLAVINAIMNLGSGLFDMGTVLTTLSWFPLDRGLVVACMKTTTGLGSSFVATIYSTYFPGNNVTYMYFLMAMSLFLGLVAIVVFYLPPFHLTGYRSSHHTETEKRLALQYQSVYMRHKAPIKRFVIAFTLVISLLIVLCSTSVVFVFIDNPTQAQRNPPTIIAIVIYVLLLSVLLPWKWLDRQPKGYDQENIDRAANEATDETGFSEMDPASERYNAREAGANDDGEDNEVRKQSAIMSEAIENDQDALEEEIEEVEEEVRQHPLETRPEAPQSPNEPAAQHKTVWHRMKGAFKSDAPTGQALEPVDMPVRTQRQIKLALRRLAEQEKVSPQFPTGFLYNIRRPTLLCLWATGFCVSGAVTVIMFNSAQIYQAVAGTTKEKQQPALYVALTSIGSALGRLVMAFIEVKTQSQPPEKRIPLTVFYCVPPILCILSCILFLFIPAHGLLAPMLLGGLGNGFYAAAEVLTVRTIFSVDVAKHYNSLFFFEMLASIFMNRLLFGELMTRNSVNNAEGMPECLDRNKCIRISFIVLTCLSAIGLLTSVIMNITYVRFARGVSAQRRQRRLELEQLLHSKQSNAPENIESQ